MHAGRLVSKWTLVAFALTIAFVGRGTAHPGSGIALDRAGNVFFVDSGSGLWKIDTAGKISKIPGAAYHWMALDATNAFARTRLPRERNTDMTAAGSNPTILLASDYPVTIGRDGNLYYPLNVDGKPLCMMKMTPAGATSVLADIPASKKGPLRWINGLAAGPDGALYYTDDNTIWRMTSNGRASIVATIQSPPNVTLVPMHTKDMGPMLRGLAVDSKGVIYVASTADGCVLKVTPDGKAETILQVQSPWSPTAVAIHGSDVYVQEYLHTTGDDRKEWLPRIRKMTPNGKQSIIATVEQMPGAR